MRIIHIRALSQSNKQVPSMISRAVPVLLAGLVPLAASSADAPAQLELVTITATRIATRIMDVPATVTVKDTAALDRELVQPRGRAALRAGRSLMRNEGGRFGPSIRGIGGNRVLMRWTACASGCVHDRQLRQRRPRHARHGAAEARRDRARPASSLYGSDAIGGGSFTTVDRGPARRRPPFGLSTKGGYRAGTMRWLGDRRGSRGRMSALCRNPSRRPVDNAERGVMARCGTGRCRMSTATCSRKIVFDASDLLLRSRGRDDTATDVPRRCRRRRCRAYADDRSRQRRRSSRAAFDQNSRPPRLVERVNGGLSP